MSMSVPTPALPAVASIQQPAPPPTFGQQLTAGNKPSPKTPAPTAFTAAQMSKPTGGQTLLGQAA